MARFLSKSKRFLGTLTLFILVLIGTFPWAEDGLQIYKNISSSTASQFINLDTSELEDLFLI